MSRLQPDEWLRERLPKKLLGAPGETFIGLLAQENGLHRLAYELGYEAALAQLSAPPVVERHLYVVSDADELERRPAIPPPRGPFTELDEIELGDDIVDDGFDTDPPPGSAA